MPPRCASLIALPPPCTCAHSLTFRFSLQIWLEIIKLLKQHPEFEGVMWPAGHESIKRKADHLIDNHLVPRAAPLPGSDEAELRRLAQAAAELRADADVAAAEHQKEKETRDLKKAETEGGREIRTVRIRLLTFLLSVTFLFQI